MRTLILLLTVLLCACGQPSTQPTSTPDTTSPAHDTAQLAVVLATTSHVADLSFWQDSSKAHMRYTPGNGISKSSGTGLVSCATNGSIGGTFLSGTTTPSGHVTYFGEGISYSNYPIDTCRLASKWEDITLAKRVDSGDIFVEAYRAKAVAPAFKTPIDTSRFTCKHQLLTRIDTTASYKCMDCGLPIK